MPRGTEFLNPDHILYVKDPAETCRRKVVTMKSLKTIQTLAKVGKVLSKIVFILCIVGFCFSLVGLATMIALGESSIVINGETLGSLIETSSGESLGYLYAVISVGMVLCAAEAVVAKFAENYFRGELADGTPFTFAGAGKMLRLGIICICVSIGSSVVAAIVYNVVCYLTDCSGDFDFSNIGAFSIGIVFIVVSVILRYGAEVSGKSVEESMEDVKS